MNHYMFELALWILAFFFVGCIIGYVLHRMLKAEDTVVSNRDEVKIDIAAPAAAIELPTQPAADIVPDSAPAVRRMERPRGLEGPRNGKPDELQRISGIGPKNEKILHTLGFFHFDQIAVWTGEHVAWVDDHLKFNGRIGREEWIQQARLLADGAEEEFESRFGKKK